MFCAYLRTKHKINKVKAGKFLLIFIQKDANLHGSFISGKLPYMFRVVSPPIIRSTHKLIYSIWYLSTVTAICSYRGRIGTGLSVDKKRGKFHFVKFNFFHLWHFASGNDLAICQELLSIIVHVRGKLYELQGNISVF